MPNVLGGRLDDAQVGLVEEEAVHVDGRRRLASRHSCTTSRTRRTAFTNTARPFMRGRARPSSIFFLDTGGNVDEPQISPDSARAPSRPSGGGARSARAGAPRRSPGLEHRRARPVGEEHRHVAARVGVVEGRGEQLRAHHEHAPVHPAAHELVASASP